VGINADKPKRWKGDIAESVDYYNAWFVRFAPRAYRESREKTTGQVESALRWTDNLKAVEPSVLREHPEVLPMLRMATAPPIAQDRLVGLAKVPKNLVSSMEGKARIPPHMDEQGVEEGLAAIAAIITRLADPDIFTWLHSGQKPGKQDVYRAATIVADRLCGSIANPIIRNAQEKRQLEAIGKWLTDRGYEHVASADFKLRGARKGTFTFRLNIPVNQAAGNTVQVPVDAAIMPMKASRAGLPFLVEAKSAGDFTNVNKRRKEEATKVKQLRQTYGAKIRYVLFLCGYFDSGYLGYEAAEGIDWVWEHRLDDLRGCGL